MPGDAALAPIMNEWVIGFLRRNPTVNTYVGGAGLDPSLREADGRLRDYSMEGLEQEDAWLAKMRGALEAVDPATLSSTSRIDRELALAQIRFLLHQHTSRHYQQRSVDSYSEEPFRAIDFQLQGMTQTGATTYGTPDEWSLVIARLNTVPWYVDNAIEQLTAGVETGNTADFRMLFRNGLEAPASNAEYFATTLPKLAEERITGANRDELLSQLRSASAKAAQAQRKFHDFIATTFFDDPSKETGVKKEFAGDRFAMGEAEYDWALTNNLHITKSAAQLYEESWPIVQATQREMFALAREIGKAHGWALPADDSAAVRAVFDKLGDDHPKNDTEMIAWYRDAAFRLVDYGRKSGLFDVPADYKLDVVETPAPLLASTDGAAYYPAPPFKDTGVGRFYVSPTGNDPNALRENNRSALADLAAHEGFPGHDWYYKALTMGREHTSPVRWLNPGAIEDSSSMWADSMASEGWALYSEALLAEPRPGFAHGLYTPEERLYQLQGKLYRDLRVRVDTGIHTGRMSYADAVDLYSQIVDFQPGSCRDLSKASDAKKTSCRVDERSIFRYSKWPTQAITYRLGKDEIYRLREAAAKQMGDRFDLKQFHMALIRQGTLPQSYFGEELLKQFR